MAQKRFDEQQLRKAVKDSYSIAQTMEKLGIPAAGGNYGTIKRYITKHDIDTSHFTGSRWNKGVKAGYRYHISDYLTNSRYIQSHILKLRLIDEGIKAHVCEKCGLHTWMEKPIPLELHHIDGNHSNNNLDNLEILCPNCHAQTDNYCSKNLKPK